jgi:hypothetical protein
MATEKLSPEKISELEATHKRIAHVRDIDGEWEVVYRRPSRAEYRRFRSSINDPQQSADATEQLARSLVVYPSREAFDALLEEWPAIPEGSSKALLRLMGTATTQEGK